VTVVSDPSLTDVERSHLVKTLVRAVVSAVLLVLLYLRGSDRGSTSDRCARQSIGV
jgi:hypothetical protein